MAEQSASVGPDGAWVLIVDNKLTDDAAQPTNRTLGGNGGIPRRFTTDQLQTIRNGLSLLTDRHIQALSSMQPKDESYSDVVLAETVEPDEKLS